MSFQVVNVLQLFFVVMFCTFFEVFFFSGEFFEFEVDEAVGLFDFIHYDIGGVVAEFSSSNLELLYIS